MPYEDALKKLQSLGKQTFPTQPKPAAAPVLSPTIPTKAKEQPTAGQRIKEGYQGLDKKLKFLPFGRTPVFPSTPGAPKFTGNIFERTRQMTKWQKEHPISQEELNKRLGRLAAQPGEKPKLPGWRLLLLSWLKL